MIYEFRLPRINPHMSSGRIECLYAEPGQTLKTGSKLLDLGIDLSSAFAQECPPVSYFRLVLRETVVLRELKAIRGTLYEIGELLAVFSTAPDDDPSQSPARGVRFASAGIIHHPGMWTGSTP